MERKTLYATGKLQEICHEMNRHRWNILGISEVHWKNFGETSSEEGHKLYYSGKENKHEHGVGFLVHKDTVKSVRGVDQYQAGLFSSDCVLHRSTSLFYRYMRLQQNTQTT